jgi:hypothetical protein
MYQLIIKRVLAWLHGITAEQWMSAINWVRQIQLTAPNATNDVKHKTVFELLKQRWPELSRSAVDVLIKIAVSYMNKV